MSCLAWCLNNINFASFGVWEGVERKLWLPWHAQRSGYDKQCVSQVLISHPLLTLSMLHFLWVFHHPSKGHTLYTMLFTALHTKGSHPWWIMLSWAWSIDIAPSSQWCHDHIRALLPSFALKVLVVYRKVCGWTKLFTTARNANSLSMFVNPQCYCKLAFLLVSQPAPLLV